MVKKKRINYKRLAILLGCLALCFYGGYKGVQKFLEPKPVEEPVKIAKSMSQDDIVDSIVQKMTLEEKVGQLFLVIPESVDDCGHDVVEPCIGFKDNQAKYNVGGIILFDNNLKDPEQTKKLIAKLQSWSKYPMFIAVDEEGGIVSRVGNTKAMRVPKVGAMKNIGDVKEAYNVGDVIGKYLHDLGFNLDFAPVTDVLINPNNVEIGSRSFGSDANRCGEFSGEVTKGLQKHNILATLKHFPGHGGYESNSHEGLSLSQRSLDELRKTEFVAFKKAMTAEPACVMVAHMSMPQLVGDKTPTTLSYKVVTEVLKGELGYKGLVVSDALNMGAIVKYYGAEETAVRCFNAGVDILLMPDKLGPAYNAVLKAVKDGTVKHERLNESVKKIVAAKVKYGIISY